MTTLPQTPDTVPAPAGQLVWPVDGVAAQLGLDGRAYAPRAACSASDAPPDPEGAGPSLGPLHGLLRADPAPPVQLVLDLADLDAIPVLPLWERRRQAAALASRPGQGTARQTEGPQDRMAKCCNLVRREASASPTMFRTERGAWSWSLVVRCNEWCCPSCGPRRARDTAAQLGAILDSWQHNDAGGLLVPDAWMLTLTVPHELPGRPDRPRTYRDADVASTVSTLYEAHALFVRSRAWRAFCRRFGISSTVRVLDAVFGGPSGAHPHFHLALLPAAAQVTGDERRAAAIQRPDVDVDLAESEQEQAARRALGERIRAARARALDPDASWPDADLPQLDDDERGTVLRYLERDVREAWRDAVEDWTGARPSSTACLRLTPGDDSSRYFTAWGLSNEVTATPIKARSHLRLLDAAGAGHAAAGAAFVEWREATAGRSWVTGLGRTRRRLGLTADDVAAHAKAAQLERDNHHRELVAAHLAEPIVLVKPLSLVIPSYLWAAAAHVGFDVLERLADYADANGLPPQETLIDACLGGLRALRGPPRPG